MLVSNKLESSSGCLTSIWNVPTTKAFRHCHIPSTCPRLNAKHSDVLRGAGVEELKASAKSLSVARRRRFSAARAEVRPDNTLIETSCTSPDCRAVYWQQFSLHGAQSTSTGLQWTPYLMLDSMRVTGGANGAPIFPGS